MDVFYKVQGLVCLKQTKLISTKEIIDCNAKQFSVTSRMTDFWKRHLWLRINQKMWTWWIHIPWFSTLEEQSPFVEQLLSTNFTLYLDGHLHKMQQWLNYWMWRWRVWQLGKLAWLKKIIWVIGVLRRTVVSDWRFDNLRGSHLQSQGFLIFNWLRLSLDSEDGFLTGCQNVSR